MVLSNTKTDDIATFGALRKETGNTNAGYTDHALSGSKCGKCNNLEPVNWHRPSGQSMFPCVFAFFRPHAARSAAVLAMVWAVGPSAATSIELGPPPGAVLAPDKLSRIDEFLNSE